MSIYAIGDLQGCLDDLKRLLDKLRFDPGKDQVWFAGDLVNRGPKSLQTLRFVRNLGESAVAVLGNHDLHLLAVAFSKRKPGSKDTLGKVIKADDAEELLNWLRHLPLTHFHEQLNTLMIHAGLPPQWSVPQAIAYGREVETVLQSDQVGEFLEQMYGDKPDLWDEGLRGMERLRFITNCLTRLRFCRPDGRIDLKHKGNASPRTKRYRPWHTFNDRPSRNVQIVFGHWSTHGFRHTDHIIALDTGCVWGGKLTAVRLDGKQKATCVKCKGAQKPG